MSEMLISVIVPAYNVENKIKRCLDGLVNQTFDKYEIIVVDDGSIDKTEVVCKEFAKRCDKVRYIRKENGGVSSARNIGIKLAKGDYIAFVDSDDYVSKDLCKGMYIAAQKYDADLVIASYYTDYNQNIKKHECCVEFCADGIAEMKEQFEWIYEDCFLNSPWNKLYKKDVISEEYREDMQYFEDYYFNVSFLEHCTKIAFVKDAYYYYVEDSQASLTKNFKEHTFDWIISIYKKQIDTLLPHLNEDTRQLFDASLVYGLYNTVQKCVYAKGKEAIKYIIDWRNTKVVSDVFKTEDLQALSRRCYSKQIEIGAYLFKYRLYRTVYILFELKKSINPVIQMLKNKYRNRGVK